MKAVLEGETVAESDDVIDVGGYTYFPMQAAKDALLERSPRTEDDDACPHGVQFYDVVLGGKRFARVGWQYEKPRAPLASTARRIGFWKDVKLV